MRIAIRVWSASLLWVTLMLASYSTGAAQLEVQERAVCTNGTIDLDRARRLRDLIRGGNSSSERLLLIRSSLDESITRCSSAINAARAAFLAGVYVDIAAELFSQGSHDDAIISYREADSLFGRFSHPDVLWLQALRGQALAELSIGHKADAEHIASTQVALAREWVNKQNFIAQELRYALTFEADLCDKSGNTKCARKSRSEARDLEESAHR